jgi:hypothetical protein
VEILNAIYEEDFLNCSYGFRPGRGQHDALDAVATGINGKANWIPDADRVVNFSPFLVRAALRTRSSLGTTAARACARTVRALPALPSAPALRSARSTEASACTFAGFIAIMAGSDFSVPLIGGYGSSLFARGPVRFA